MLLWRVPKNNTNTGFTLIEILVTTIVVGVIAAIAAPNILGLLNRNRVNDAFGQLEGAIKEAQKQATRNGSACTINMNDSDNGNSVSGGCLLSNRNFDDVSNQIEFYANQPTITFSGKGNTTVVLGNQPVFVISMSNGNSTDLQKCVVIENSLGTLRTGYYTGTLDPADYTNVQAANCS